MSQPSQNRPTDSPPLPQSVGPEDGDHVRGLAVLHPMQEVSLPCYYCGRETTFLAQFAFPQGWWGVCMSCGDERLVPYTRTMEAA